MDVEGSAFEEEFVAGKDPFAGKTDFVTYEFTRRIGDQLLAQFVRRPFTKAVFKHLQFAPTATMRSMYARALKELYIEDCTIDPEALLGLVRRCSALEKLEICLHSGTYFKVPGMRGDHWKWIAGTFLDGVTIPRLRSVVIEVKALDHGISPQTVIGFLKRHPNLDSAEVTPCAFDPSVFKYRLERGIPDAIPSERMEDAREGLKGVLVDFLVNLLDADAEIGALPNADVAESAGVPVSSAREEARRRLGTDGAPADKETMINIARADLVSHVSGVDDGKEFVEWVECVRDPSKPFPLRSTRFFSRKFMKRVGDAELARMLAQFHGGSLVSLSYFAFVLDKALDAVDPAVRGLWMYNVAVHREAFLRLMGRLAERGVLQELHISMMPTMENADGQWERFDDSVIDAIRIESLTEVHLMLPRGTIRPETVINFIRRHPNLTSINSLLLPGGTFGEERYQLEGAALARLREPDVSGTAVAPAASRPAKMECRAVLTGPRDEVDDESGEPFHVYDLALTIRDGLGSSRQIPYPGKTIRDAARLVHASTISEDARPIRVTRVVFNLIRSVRGEELNGFLDHLKDAGVETLVVRGDPPTSPLRLPPGMRLGDLRLMTMDAKWADKMAWAKVLVGHNKAFLARLHITAAGPVTGMPRAAELLADMPSLRVLRVYPPTAEKVDHVWDVHGLQGAIEYTRAAGTVWCTVADRFDYRQKWCRAFLDANGADVTHLVADTPSLNETVGRCPNVKEARLYVITEEQARSTVGHFGALPALQSATFIAAPGIKYGAASIYASTRGKLASIHYKGSPPLDGYAARPADARERAAGDDDARSASSWGTVVDGSGWYASGSRARTYETAPASASPVPRAVPAVEAEPREPVAPHQDKWERSDNTAQFISIITHALPEDAPGVDPITLAPWAGAHASPQNPVVAFESNGELCFARARDIARFSGGPIDAPLRDPVHGHQFGKNGSQQIRAALERADQRDREVIDVDALPDEPQRPTVPTGKRRKHE